MKLAQNWVVRLSIRCSPPLSKI